MAAHHLAVDGVVASRTSAPASVAELSAILREGERSGERVVFCGAGTKLDWGAPPLSLDHLVDLSRLDPVLEHAAGDLVVRVGASVTLAELNGQLALAGQRLALDEVVAGSTIGGVVATGLSGPLRFAFGGVRDLLIGIRVVRADGVVARSGGRVVKNVAGYDLGKLFTGSYGTLGAVAECFFRCHPLPAASARLRLVVDRELEAAGLLRRLARSKSALSALELHREGPGAIELHALLEGSARGVAQRVAALRGELDELSPGAIVALDEAPPHFGRLPGRTTLKCTFVPGEVGAVLSRLAGDPALREARLAGAASFGLLYVGFDELGALGPVIATLRRIAAQHGGSAVVLRAPRELRAGVDPWGPVSAGSLHRAVKTTFDPALRLAPGRFVAGL